MRVFTLRFRDLFACLLIAVVYAHPSDAHAINPASRTIAILFDSGTEKTPEVTIARLFLEAPLNALGLATRYVDINQPADLERLLDPEIRAVVSAFPPGTRLKSPLKLMRLWERLIDNGKKLLLFGEIGILADTNDQTVPAKERARFFNRFGLEFSGEFATNSLDYRPVVTDAFYALPGAVIPPSFSQSPVLKISSEHAIALMRGRPSDSQKELGEKNEGLPLLVLHKQNGLISLADSAFSIIAPTADAAPIRSWHIDPLRLLSAALELSEIPRADLTTAFGARIVLALIQGSGLGRPTNVEKYLSSSASSLTVLDRELIAPMRNILFTLSPVMAEFGARASGENQTRLIKQVFGYDNVAAATSGLSNIYHWPDNDENTEELKQEFKGYSARPESEIGKALEALKVLLPVAEKSACYVASDANTIPKSIEHYLSDHDICSIVGGSGRLDPLHPNIAWLEPVSRALHIGDDVNKRFPVTFPFASERQYISDEGLAEYAYRYLTETVKRSESPVRLTPVGIRIQTAAGSSAIRLAAIRSVFESLPELLFPLSITDYADMVRDFQRMQISRCGPDCWHVLNRGKISTVRISSPRDYWIDYQRSTGVLGSRRLGDELFVALDPADANPRLQFSLTKSVDAIELLDSRWKIQRLIRGENSLQFDASGTGEGAIRLTLPWSGALQISLLKSGKHLETPPYSLDHGILSLRLSATAPDTHVTVKLLRRDNV